MEKTIARMARAKLIFLLFPESKRDDTDPLAHPSGLKVKTRKNGLQAAPVMAFFSRESREIRPRRKAGLLSEKKKRRGGGAKKEPSLMLRQLAYQ